MTLPTLLLVDDSESILAFERAALHGAYACLTASDGADALEKAKQIVPDGILLDLSMPIMSGDEVLRKLQADPQLRDVPVIIISSETKRAEACLALGAVAFLPKPLRADQLVKTVDRELEKARRARIGTSLQLLPVRVADVQFAVPLESVALVLTSVATQPLPLGPFYLREFFLLHGEPICVLDVAARLGTKYSGAMVERKFVVVEDDGRRVALSVDEVHDPEEVPSTSVKARARLGAGDHGMLAEALVSVARTSRGSLPVINPMAFLSRDAVRRLSSMTILAPGQWTPWESAT